MSEWLSYSPRDLLMFTEETYRRLFENHNAALWPLHAVAVIAGVAIAILLVRGGSVRSRCAAVLLAVVWLAVAGGWFEWRFSTIHTGARIMAAAFALEAVALLWFGAVRDRLAVTRVSGIRGWLGVALLAWGMAIHASLGAALGRPWTQSEVFALAPDPTAIATIGVLLLARRAPWILWIVPVGWCLFSGITLWAMHTPDAWLPPVIAVGGATLSLFNHRLQRQAT